MISLREELLDALEQMLTDDAKSECNQLLADMCDPYVPYATGALATNVTVDSVGVTYNQPYAMKVYNDLDRPFNQEHHPLATARWDEVMMQTQGDEFQQGVQNILDRHSSKLRLRNG